MKALAADDRARLAQRAVAMARERADWSMAGAAPRQRELGTLDTWLRKRSEVARNTQQAYSILGPPAFREAILRNAEIY